LPANSGRTVVFSRIQNLQLQPAGLSGTAQAGEAFGSAHPLIHATAGQLKQDTYQVDQIPATLNIYGNDLQLTELLMLTSEPNPVPELMEAFTYNGAATLNQKAINLMTGDSANGDTLSTTVPSIDYNGASPSVTVVWGDGSSTLTEVTLDADIPTHLLAAESFNQASFNLRNNSVKTHRTTPGRYASLISPGMAANLRVDGTFQEIALKGHLKGENKFEAATVGDVFGCRVMESAQFGFSAATIDSTNDENHYGITLGKDYAFKVSHARGVGRPRVTFIPPKPSAADVYGNNGYLSWKAYFAGIVTNPLAGIIHKVSTTNTRTTASGDDGAWDT